MMKSLLILTSFFLLLSCSNAKKMQVELTPVIKYHKQLILCDNPPPNENVSLLPITWVVATENATGNQVIGLSPEDYENLSKNTEMLKKVLQQKLLKMVYYKNCIKDYNKGVP